MQKPKCGSGSWLMSGGGVRCLDYWVGVKSYDHMNVIGFLNFCMQSPRTLTTPQDPLHKRVQPSWIMFGLVEYKM